MSRRTGIMLCQPFDEKRLAKWSPPYIIQPKYDGHRCRALVDSEGNTILLSSEENEITHVPHINEAIKASGLRDVELDGELYVHGWSFEKITGVVSRSVNYHSEFETMQLHIFDMVSRSPQIIRLNHLHGFVDLWRSDVLHLAPMKLASNLDEIMFAFDTYCSAGYEGIIIRHIEAPYERKRSLYVMKFKPKKEDIYEIVGFQEEISITGHPKGTLGALICKAPDSPELFSVGTGFNAAQRSDLWKDREALPGRFVRILYQHTTPGRGVPRFPVFAEVISSNLG